MRRAIFSGASRLLGSKLVRPRRITTEYPNAVDRSALIGAEELHAMLQDPDNDVVVLDVRNPAAYADGHIPGSFNLHDCFTYLAMTTPEGLEALRNHFTEKFSQAGIRPDSRVVVYEQQMNTGYGQSCRGYFLLKYLGVKNASVLNGAMADWDRLRLPLSRAPVPPQRTQFTPNIASELMATREDLLVLANGFASGKIGPHEHVLMDVRDKEEWVAQSSSPYGKDFAPNKGRIPGAVWAEWYHFLHYVQGISKFESAEAILDEAHAHGIDDLDTPITLYCFKGSRASNTMLALQLAGFRNVRNAFGSWNEWCRDPSLPVDTKILEGE